MYLSMFNREICIWKHNFIQIRPHKDNLDSMYDEPSTRALQIFVGFSRVSFTSQQCEIGISRTYAFCVSRLLKRYSCIFYLGLYKFNHTQVISIHLKRISLGLIIFKAWNKPLFWNANIILVWCTSKTLCRNKKHLSSNPCHWKLWNSTILVAFLATKSQRQESLHDGYQNQ